MPPRTQRRNCAYLNRLKVAGPPHGPDLRLISGARSSGVSDPLTWRAEPCAATTPGRRGIEDCSLSIPRLDAMGRARTETPLNAHEICAV